MNVGVRDDAWLTGDEEREGSRCVGAERRHGHRERCIGQDFSRRSRDGPIAPIHRKAVGEHRRNVIDWKSR